MPATDPFSTECTNDNRDDFWTCPACYEDFNERYAGTHTCNKCGRQSDCTVKMIPTATAVLIDVAADDD